MKYYLVDNFTDNIVDTVDLGSDVGVSGARTFYIGRKLMTNDEKSFDKIWRVMTKKDYDMSFKTTLQNRQLDKRKYEWWKDEETYLDVDAPITQSIRDEE
tara:strand:+ start:301 stop:600 length:300 start_codon:yes stop_codon:yes gene_type:complete